MMFELSNELTAIMNTSMVASEQSGIGWKTGDIKDHRNAH